MLTNMKIDMKINMEIDVEINMKIDVEINVTLSITIRASFRIFTGRVHHIKGSVFLTGAPCIGKCFQDGCTPKLTGARAPGAPVLTEPLFVLVKSGNQAKENLINLTQSKSAFKTKIFPTINDLVERGLKLRSW